LLQNLRTNEPKRQKENMMEIEITNRIKELMIEQGLDVSNELLAMDITIIYLQAQRDSLIEQHEEAK